MGVLPVQLLEELRDQFGVRRAIETGTYRGRGARLLASVFPEVVTIELAPLLAAAATLSLKNVPGVEVREGSSRDVLPELIQSETPTLYWLDGHWSGGSTGGEADECPVLAELEAISAGHSDDCILIDDARLFLAPPPPPHRPEHWPTFVEIREALATWQPDHVVLAAHDIVVAVPAAASDAVRSFAVGKAPRGSSLLRRGLDRLRTG